MLFGTRVSQLDLTWESSSESLLIEGHAHPEIIGLATRIGVTLVD